MKMSKEIEKKDYYNILYGFYQPLLTTKQCQIFEDYYAEDYSLAEIAEDLAISRNAVWDSLKKVTDKLDDYESKMHLVANNQLLMEYLQTLEKYTNDDGQKIIQKIREME